MIGFSRPQADKFKFRAGPGRRVTLLSVCLVTAVVGLSLASSGVAGAMVRPAARAAVVYNNGYQNELWCPSSSECVAVASNGSQSTFNPIKKSTVKHSQPVRSLATQDQLGLTCVSASLCVEADASGEVATFDPKAPKRKLAKFAVTGQYAQTAVACPSKSRCVVETWTGEAVFNPKHVGKPKTTTITANGSAVQPSLSCPSQTQCDGDDGDSSQVYTYNPLHAAAAAVHTLKSTPQVGMNDCLSTSFCAALAAPAIKNGVSSGINLGIITYNPKKPGKPKVNKITGNSMETLTCASKTLCAAGGNNDGVFLFNPKHPDVHKHFVAFPYGTDTVGISFIGTSRLVILSFQGKKAVISAQHPPKSVGWAFLGKATKVKAG